MVIVLGTARLQPFVSLPFCTFSRPVLSWHYDSRAPSTDFSHPFSRGQKDHKDTRNSAVLILPPVDFFLCLSLGLPEDQTSSRWSDTVACFPFPQPLSWPAAPTNAQGCSRQAGRREDTHCKLRPHLLGGGTRSRTCLPSMSVLALPHYLEMYPLKSLQASTHEQLLLKRPSLAEPAYWL